MDLSDSRYLDSVLALEEEGHAEPKKRCKRKPKVKPWENPDLVVPDFGPDMDGKKEFMWKIMQIPKIKPGRLILAIGWGMVMAMLDMSIINVALVVLTGFFNSSKERIQWIVDGYSICLAAFSIIAGKLGDRYGAIRVNHVGMVTFVIFSVACALSPAGNTGLIIMIVFRCLQGVSASFLMSTTMAIGTTLVDPLGTSMLMSYNSLLTTAATALGPTIGGLLTQVSWRLIFLINVPFGIIGFLCTTFMLPSMPRLIEKHFDIIGAILTACFLALLVFGVAQILVMPIIAGCCIALSFILVVGFCFHEIRFQCPILPKEVLFNYKVISSLTAGIFNFATTIIITYQGPFLVQFAWKYSPTIAGLIYLPQSVASAIFSLLSGFLCRKYTASSMRWVGNILSIIGTAIAACAGPGGVGVFILAACIVWSGMGFFVTASNTYIMIITPVNAKGAMGGAVQCFRETGFSLGVALSCVFSEHITDILWGKDVPSMDLPCPDDFVWMYEISYTWTAVCSFIWIWVAILLVLVAGWHEYEVANNFKWMPKKTRAQLKVSLAALTKKGLDPFGVPMRTEAFDNL